MDLARTIFLSGGGEWWDRERIADDVFPGIPLYVLEGKSEVDIKEKFPESPATELKEGDPGSFVVTLPGDCYSKFEAIEPDLRGLCERTLCASFDALTSL